MNDSKFSHLLKQAKDGHFDSMMIAFPCTTFSIARFFDAPDQNGNRGPEPIRDKDNPDGIPEDRLTPAQIKELRASNRLLDRTIDLAIAARLSPSKTTIVFENPADRTVRGTPHFMEDIPHGSFFATSQIKRFKQAVGDTSEVTFAYCRFGGDSQKYATLLYTNDAATVLDQLSGPNYQCNHPPRSHKNQVAGGRSGDGWASAAEAAYPDQLCVRLAMAFTCWAGHPATFQGVEQSLVSQANPSQSPACEIRFCTLGSARSFFGSSNEDRACRTTCISYFAQRSIY